MRIERLEIYGYGKWVDTSFDIAKDIHVFHGLNEAGKSTLMSFMHSILFGFPTRSSTLLRYEPRESSRYGGKIFAHDRRFGDVIIERIHGKVTGDVTVTLEDGTTGSDEILETLLNGMTRESYQNIFSFSLTDIENVHKLNKNQLSRYLLNIGAHGTEYYLELADQFQTTADKIYRPSGRVLELNKQLTALEKQEKKLADLEQKNANYLSLIEQLNAENDAIEKIENKQKQREKRLEDIVELKKQWHVFEEINTLEAEVVKFDLPPLKKDGRSLLEEYKREKANLNGKLQEVQIKTNEARQALKEAEMIEAYEENKEGLVEVENNLPEMIEKLRDYEAVVEKRSDIQKELLEIEQALNIVDQPMYPIPFTAIEEENVSKWLNIVAEYENKQAEISQNMQQIDNALALKNQKLDQIESSMWASEEFKQVEEDIKTDATATTDKRPALYAGIAGVLFLLFAFFIPSPTNWIVAILGVLAFVLAFLFLKAKPKKEANALLLKEYDKQVHLKQEYQVTLTEADVIQAQYQGMQNNYEQAKKEIIGIQNSWRQLLESHHLPNDFAFDQTPMILQQVATLHQLLQEDDEQGMRQNRLKQQLDQETAIIHNVLTFVAETPFKEKIMRFRQYLSHVKSEMAREQEKLDQLTALKQEEKEIKNNLEHTATKIITLIETTGVKEEADFIALYQEKEIFDTKVNRLRFLKENAPNHQAYQVLPSRDELERKAASFHQELESLKQEKNKTLREMTNTQLMIENLEQDGTYSEELQVFENQKATAQRLVDEWASNKVAGWLIQDTLNQVTRDRFEAIIGDAETYFSLLTDSDYERIVFQDEELFVQLKNGQVVDVRVLSRGTAEPLYVAIRLAYIKNTTDILELPVIMDDPFVNFDAQRRVNTYKLLEFLQEDLQIIYFTFDPVARDYFTTEQISDLEVRNSNG